MNEYIILICHLVRRRWNFKYTQKSTQALKYLSDAGCILPNLIDFLRFVLMNSSFANAKHLLRSAFDPTKSLLRAAALSDIPPSLNGLRPDKVPPPKGGI